MRRGFVVCRLSGKEKEKIEEPIAVFDTINEAYKFRDELIAKSRPADLVKERYGIRF